jgi:hypothetical protein
VAQQHSIVRQDGGAQGQDRQWMGAHVLFFNIAPCESDYDPFRISRRE